MSRRRAMSSIRVVGGQQGNDSFITRWNLLSGDSITLPTPHSGNDYVVDWGDGSPTEAVTSGTAPSHVYGADGTYDITLTGTCPSWNVNNSMTNQEKCVEVVNWGQMSFTELNFYGCKITTLPNGPITGAVNVTDFGNCFRDNSLTSIPLGLFDNTPNVIIFERCFQDNSITSIPTGLFNNTPNVANFSDCFRENSLTSIPTGLFDNTPNVIIFQRCFRGNSITSIPTGLFDNTPNVIIFERCFLNNSITSIPTGLFNNTPNVTSFRDCFFNNSITSSVPELWLRNPNPPNYDTGDPDGQGCFANNPDIANIADIPVYWK